MVVVAVCCSVLQCVVACCNWADLGWAWFVQIWGSLSVDDSLFVRHTIHMWMFLSLRHATTHCNALQHTTTHCNKLQHTATHCNTLHITMLCYVNVSLIARHNLLQYGWQRASHDELCDTLQHTATHYHTLQHTATHCNTLHLTTLCYVAIMMTTSKSWRIFSHNKQIFNICIVSGVCTMGWLQCVAVCCSMLQLSWLCFSQ